MPVKSYNPTSPGRRFQTTSTFEEVTRSTPEKSLVVKISPVSYTHLTLPTILRV